MVEHWSPKPGVGRSSRSSRANIFKMNKVKIYLQETYNELVHKVTWPSWAELQGSAIAVMIASFIIALVVMAMDISFQKIMEYIYNLMF